MPIYDTRYGQGLGSAQQGLNALGASLGAPLNPQWQADRRASQIENLRNEEILREAMINASYNPATRDAEHLPMFRDQMRKLFGMSPLVEAKYGEVTSNPYEPTAFTYSNMPGADQTQRNWIEQYGGNPASLMSNEPVGNNLLDALMQLAISNENNQQGPTIQEVLQQQQMQQQQQQPWRNPMPQFEQGGSVKETKAIQLLQQLLNLDRDEVPVVAHEGEYIVNKEAADQIGPEALNAINNLPRMQSGGSVGIGRRDLQQMQRNAQPQPEPPGGGAGYGAGAAIQQYMDAMTRMNQGSRGESEGAFPSFPDPAQITDPRQANEFAQAAAREATNLQHLRDQGENVSSIKIERLIQLSDSYRNRLAELDREVSDSGTPQQQFQAQNQPRQMTPWDWQGTPSENPLWYPPQSNRPAPPEEEEPPKKGDEEQAPPPPSKDSSERQDGGRSISTVIPPQPEQQQPIFGYRPAGSSMPIDWNQVSQMEPAMAAQYLQRVANTQGQYSTIPTAEQAGQGEQIMPPSQRLFGELMAQYQQGVQGSEGLESQNQKLQLEVDKLAAESPFFSALAEAKLDFTNAQTRNMLAQASYNEERNRNNIMTMMDPMKLFTAMNTGVNMRQKVVDGLQDQVQQASQLVEQNNSQETRRAHAAATLKYMMATGQVDPNATNEQIRKLISDNKEGMPWSREYRLDDDTINSVRYEYDTNIRPAFEQFDYMSDLFGMTTGRGLPGGGNSFGGLMGGE